MNGKWCQCKEATVEKPLSMRFELNDVKLPGRHVDHLSLRLINLMCVFSFLPAGLILFYVLQGLFAYEIQDVFVSDFPADSRENNRGTPKWRDSPPIPRAAIPPTAMHETIPPATTHETIRRKIEPPVALGKIPPILLPSPPQPASPPRTPLGLHRSSAISGRRFAIFGRRSAPALPHLRPLLRHCGGSTSD
ncbi:hypothetical protein SEVIR_4G235350v4 [Setaria viridis]